MDYPENRLEGNVQQKNNKLDLNRYHTADHQQKTEELMLENAACELQELEESDSVQLFQRQVELLKRRMLNNPLYLSADFHGRGDAGGSLGIRTGRIETGIHLDPLEIVASR